MRLHQARIYAFSAVVVMTACVLPLRHLLTFANLTMIYLLLVLIISIRSDTKTAFAAAFLSFICINFFLVPPFYSLWVADPREVFDLCVFLIVAAIGGRLAADAREQTRQAQHRAREQEILYRLTRAFNQLTQNEGVYEALTKALREDLGAIQVHILPDTRDSAAVDTIVHYLPLMGGDHVYGTVRAAFATTLTPPQTQLLNTCVSQAGMALQRIDLAERARKSEQFEEADRLKTAILHAVSHDLRTPITIIKTSASNLRHLNERLAADEKLTIAETIENEVDQLNKLVGNLLDMSRLQAGALRLDCQLNSMEEIAGDVAARVWQLTKQERIRLDFPDDMPLVNFDYGLLLQAVTNLVDNALRYEPPVSQVEIRGEMQSDAALLKVINHGVTISPEIKAHMMEPFYHGKEGRTGLGLPIAKGILDAHMGQLWVEDTPGSGATFVMSLPFNKDDKRETQNLDC